MDSKFPMVGFYKGGMVGRGTIIAGPTNNKASEAALGTTNLVCADAGRVNPNAYACAWVVY